MNALVGYTGFVGSNLYASGDFDAGYNSQNVQDAYGTNPELLVYAGLRAEKYLANNDSVKDLEQIEIAKANICKINPRKLILISTVDVFKEPWDVDENSGINTKGLHAYGYNRYLLECWVREHYPDALIIRLPGLFGKNMKKNFIYDYINMVPFMLDDKKFVELFTKEPLLENYYEPLNNGFYKVKIPDCKREVLKDIFRSLGYSALNFTDSRSTYQFYNLAHLWKDIRTALRAGITLWHPATEPVSAGELYKYLTGDKFVNKLDGKPAFYNCKTIYSDLFGGRDGYLCSKTRIMIEIKTFTEGVGI